jgi:hypothetical protein
MDFKNLKKKSVNQTPRDFCQMYVISKKTVPEGMDLKIYKKIYSLAYGFFSLRFPSLGMDVKKSIENLYPAFSFLFFVISISVFGNSSRIFTQCQALDGLDVA